MHAVHKQALLGEEATFQETIKGIRLTMTSVEGPVQPTSYRAGVMERKESGGR